MPTKFNEQKWLCDYCQQIFKCELSCHLHEREAHNRITPEMSLDALFAEILQRLQREVPTYTKLKKYENFSAIFNEKLRQKIDAIPPTRARETSVHLPVLSAVESAIQVEDVQEDEVANTSDVRKVRNNSSQQTFATVCHFTGAVKNGRQPVFAQWVALFERNLAKKLTEQQRLQQLHQHLSADAYWQMKSMDESVQNNYSKLVRELCRLFPSASKRMILEPDDFDDDSTTERGERGPNVASEFKRQRSGEPEQTDDDDECWNDRTDEDASGEEPTVFECGLCPMSLVE